MIYTLVDSVRSLFNVGAIFRTADGAGVDKIFLTGITGCPPHREIRKVALGAEETVSWQYERECLPLLQQLKKQGVSIVVLEMTQDSIPYDTVDYVFPLCLVVGNEYHGVSENVLREANLVVEIPMCGAKESLNVAVAFGVAIYEIGKQRQGRTGGK